MTNKNNKYYDKIEKGNGGNGAEDGAALPLS